MLGEIGVTPDAITDIVLSHAHFDHMGSIAEFPKARIYIQKQRDSVLDRGDRAAAADSAS